MAAPISSGDDPQASESDGLSAYQAFVTLHRYQLEQIPESLWRRLFEKLCADQLDAGSHFCLAKPDATNDKLNFAYTLRVIEEHEPILKHSDIFLVDHAWTTKPENSRAELAANEALLNRMAVLMNVDSDTESEDEEGEEKEENNEEKEEKEKEDSVGDDKEQSSVKVAVTERGDETSKEDEAIQIVASQVGVTETVARAALVKENWDLISAISDLTLPHEVRESDQALQANMVRQVETDQHRKLEVEHRERRISGVLKAMWRYVQTYQVTAIDKTSETRRDHVWYIMDEVGSSILHSDTPNSRLVPFLFVRGPTPADTIPYSVFFPLTDLNAGDDVTRDFVPANINDLLAREAYLCFIHPPNAGVREKLVEAYQNYKRNSTPFSASALKSVARAPLIQPTSTSDVLRVYTDANFVKEHLTIADTELVDSPEAANLIWLTKDVYEFSTFRKDQLVNQIPGEFCVTYKHNLAKLIRETYGNVSWHPATYNLLEELPIAVGAYLAHEEVKDDKEEKNLWILKPWNFARGIGISVTDSLARLIRARDDVPTISQHYLSRPALYEGRKFDLRYIVLLRSTQPLRVAVYDMFWVRLANKPYALDDLGDYEKHFTVMNYSPYQVTQLRHTDFIEKMTCEHPGLHWPAIQEKIDTIFKPTAQPAPLGYPSKSDAGNECDTFAIYGLDVILTDKMEPVVLEVNFGPDCLRACHYEPNFVNHLVSAVTGHGDVSAAQKALREI